MAMFDIGKRGSSSHQNQKDEAENAPHEFDAPRGSAVPASGTGAARNRDAAIIGPSIHIEGTLRGEEDLVIEGRVSGTVKLQGHSLTVGTHGQINADIYAHAIVVDGTVEGDLFGVERVVIRKSANIRGNVISPRVSLEEGARFKGAIEMDAQAVEEAMGTRNAKSAAEGQGSSSPGMASSRMESTSLSPSSSPAAVKTEAADKPSGGKTGSGAG